MKHTFKITFLLLSLFIAAQLIGLFIVQSYVDSRTVIVDGKTQVERSWKDLPYQIERPTFEEKTAFLPVLFFILVATVILLIFVKLRLFLLWKFWFFLSVWLCLIIAFGAFVSDVVAVALALFFALLKIFRQNVVVHNLTELFIYGGLAAIFVPVFNIFSISVLLVAIAIYDFIAVHKTKHMVAMAKFQSASKLFAGLFIPYGKQKTAVLGGGDIAFPLLFTAVLFHSYGFGALIVTGTTTLALAYLLWKSEQNKFYPAMPFLATGCFVGYFFLVLLFAAV
ncbi:MAG: presenilin family intramembrane aspartyl protease [Nanoarchaeota archaeon]